MADWKKIEEKGYVEDRRWAAPAVVWWIGAVWILLVLWVAIFGNGEQAMQLLQTMEETSPRTVQYDQSQAAEFEWNDAYEEFATRVLWSNDALWSEIFRKSNMTYTPPKLVLFRQWTQSGCGWANSATWPHYCPADETIYLDETFFAELTKRFGAQWWDVAEAYVIAHEVGHHVQNKLGINTQVRKLQQQNPSQKNQLSVLQELQADCYAWLWAHSIKNDGVFEQGEILEAIDAAEAVGDDRIQQTTQWRVNPESWTHWSSEDRKKWFMVGYTQGDVNLCDTFSS